ncbi:hypothetical protein C791_6272 [Amycolatopsis azurea DSM 43854]|uniref:Uncharacterized protein n=1 Tax=Amycolatopsis azurea DSM 43854 TaxID=1238180 RepID=M2NPL1_9PSEU|nr:hypothetical protein C791_6272 [Amycolatopsis azurea DSM 43854]
MRSCVDPALLHEGLLVRDSGRRPARLKNYTTQCSVLELRIR